jgi:hypothetical protein
MVGAPGSPGRPSLMFLSVDGGRSRTFSSGTSQGPHCRCFLALMVDAPGLSTLTPFGGPRQCFLALMVGALGPPASAPPGGGGAPSMFLSVDGGCSQITSSGTSWGSTVDVS